MSAEIELRCLSEDRWGKCALDLLIKLLLLWIYLKENLKMLTNFSNVWNKKKFVKIHPVRWRERNQHDATNLMFIIKFYLNMFRASLCPSSGEQECLTPHMVFCTGCDGCGCVKLGRELCAAPHNHSHHNQCRTPYAAVLTLVLLMMGIMMPETCWDKSLKINIRLVASCWFLSLHPTFMMHGHKSLKSSSESRFLNTDHRTIETMWQI